MKILDFKKIDDFISNYTNIIKLLAFIVSVLFIFFAFDTYINNSIEKQLTTEYYLSKLSQTLRPFCLFDMTGTIIYDHGVHETYIDSIKVNKYRSKKDRQENKFDEIIIYTSKYLRTAPLIEYISYDLVIIHESERINNKIWVYNCEIPETLGFESTRPIELFRLEILK